MSKIFDYAGFYFGKTNFWMAAEAHGEEFAAEMAAMFHEQEITPGDGSFEDSVTSLAKRLAELSGLEDVTVKKPQPMCVSIYEKGECVGFVDIDVYPDDAGMVMANGDTVGNLWTYGWKGLRKLERVAA